MKKIALSFFGLIVLGALGLYALIFNVPAVQDRILENATSFAGQPQNQFLFEDDALRVLLCGTGSPLPDPNRAGPCNAVFAGGQYFVIDTGAGTTRNLNGWQIPPDRLTAILLTHYHSDHIAELGEHAMYSWANGRQGDLPLFGPKGVDRVAAGFNEAYALDKRYRIAHHGEDLMNPAFAGVKPEEFTLSKTNPSKIIFDQKGVTITAFSVDHSPIDPAVGYRFDYKGRSVVISGDTVKDDNLIKVSEGTDILIHEALSMDIVSTISKNAKANGNDRLAKITHDILDYHTSPVQAAEAAQEANVGMLVYSHIVPPIINRFVETVFLRGTADSFDGPIILGEDGMMFTLPVGSDAVEQMRMKGL